VCTQRVTGSIAKPVPLRLTKAPATTPPSDDRRAVQANISMTSDSHPAGTRFGRFVTSRVLGAGGEGTVYLATDTQLGRQVAVKTVSAQEHQGRPQGLGDAGVDTLLDEARIVSTLSHPNIVPLYDAGEQDGSPYLVFEYVDGQTLAALIAAQGRLKIDRAVEIAIALASGVAYAHDHNIVHRDIKPANVMVTPDGIARLMDFGIARRATTLEDNGLPIVGTPSYLAPEYIVKRRHLPVSDVFALGVVLYEMLAGVPPICGSSPRETARRIVEEAFEPPSVHNRDVDERLDALVMKALAKEVSERFAGATDMVTALRDYLEPEPSPEIAGNTQGTLEYLLRRIRHKGDFPALASTITAVNRASASDREPVGVLCNAILKDLALTGRLLKLVNATHLIQFGGSISTVSRAISILGYDVVRNVSMSLVLFEHMHNRANAAALKDQVVATYFSGLLSRQLYDCADLRDGEQAFICAMFHRLGKLLATFYLHDEAQVIERHAQARGCSEEQAAKTVLGIGFEELGVGVAKAWNFPEEIIDSMRVISGSVKKRPTQHTEKLRLIASLANELCGVIQEGNEPRRKEKLAALVDRYGAATGISERSLTAAIQASTKSMVRDAVALGQGVGNNDFLRAASAWGGSPEPVLKVDAGMSEAQALAATTVSAAGLAGGETDTHATGDALWSSGPATPAVGHESIGGERPEAAPSRQDSADEQLQKAAAGAMPVTAPTQSDQRQTALAAGVQDVANAMVSDPSLNDLLRIILESMYRAIGFQRVLLFMLDARMQTLRCRFGFGLDTDKIVQSGVAAPLNGPRDLFYAAVVMGADLCIDDLESEKVRQHVPQWYRSAIGARGIVLLPIVNKKRTLGLIYADSDTPATLRFSAAELGLLKTLRNQALLAMRQST
jgi:serine/threonine protein kinase